MSIYYGLIIPRSYNDYINKSQPAEFKKAMENTGLIPATASEENQLADKNFVNSTVGTNTANYIYKTDAAGENVPFDSIEELEAYSGEITNNDYAFVTGTDTAGNIFFDRYKAVVNDGVVSWGKEYRLNNSSFTSEQWASIQSGITAEKVAQYDALVDPIDDTTTRTDKTYSSQKIDDTYAKNTNVVPNTRKINNKPLNSDITLGVGDISGALGITAANLTATVKYIKFTNGLIIQWGKQTANINLGGGDNADGAAITFATAAKFTAEPSVILTAIGGNQMNMTAPNVTANGFTPRYRNVNTNTSATATGCYWLAIGK